MIAGKTNFCRGRAHLQWVWIAGLCSSRDGVGCGLGSTELRVRFVNIHYINGVETILEMPQFSRPRILTAAEAGLLRALQRSRWTTLYIGVSLADQVFQEKHWRDPVTSKPRAIGQCLLAGFTNSFRVETALAPKVCAFPDFSPSWLWHVRIQSCCTGSMPKPSMLFQLTFGRQDGNWHWSCVQESCLEHTPEIKAEASGVCVCARVATLKEFRPQHCTCLSC